ncbi:MAG: 7-carboxy-7-deazaguanine synthase QueE [Microcoleaceae cyanobacterium]
MQQPVGLNQHLVPIHETFQQTIQGEGYWVGTPVDFIRLAGCPVRCFYCDTGYSNGGQSLPRNLRSITDLMAELQANRVVISGGEPFIHPQLPELVQAIQATQRQVSIETSGAFWQDIGLQGWVTLSPKQHISPEYPVLEQMWQRANEIKLIIQTGDEVAFYAEHLAARPEIPVFLQPEWTKREQAIPIILNLLHRFPTYRLSVQVHKYLEIP